MFSNANIWSEKSFVIVRFLGRNYNESFYVRELSGILGLALGPVSETLKGLFSAGILKREVRGRIVNYRANMNSPLLLEMKILITLMECQKLLAELEIPEKKVIRIILFGSCARGEDSFESDIDLLIETDEKKKISSLLNSYEFIEDRKLSAVIVTPNELRNVRNRDRPFYERVMQGKELYRRTEDEIKV